jgi:hypothetical protein
MKEIKFKLADRVLTAQLGSRVEKKALYGYSRKVAEKEGKILSRGLLSADGRLLRRDEVSLVKLDPEGTPVEEIVTEVDGQIAELQPSAFEQENELRPTTLVRLATFAVSDVYPVDELPLEPGLYETRFSFRKSIQPKEALLLVKENAGYLLVGEARQSAFVGLHVTYSFFDADEEPTEEGEELDFSMV